MRLTVAVHIKNGDNSYMDSKRQPRDGRGVCLTIKQRRKNTRRVFIILWGAKGSQQQNKLINSLIGPPYYCNVKRNREAIT